MTTDLFPEYTPHQYQVLSPDGLERVLGRLDTLELLAELLSTLTPSESASKAAVAVSNFILEQNDALREQLAQQQSTPKVSDESTLFS